MVEVKSPYSIIKLPLINEKSEKMGVFNKYVFVVDRRANKIEIKKAIEDIYNVNVRDVNIINMKGKSKRIRWGQEGKTSSWKKAIVTLKKGEEIKLT
ncbi:MAG: 50S ribosomal protein L23 [Candidatus Omnitrophica bacterium]|nr:50S ribosomal protein L23 [Candidatus Omnitrophota bacterium]MCM8827212.1 50S ribosomal protein L23 [Candidatus Omnitrophota bacterium]